ncbi:pentatricopeptide repeat-containing protein At1g11290, chloroplastic-like [Ananas comosus]|uniref:Pentatricopeptide repeat-containing protein At1g11290, chloroplastic-like n=1 Tax=Ananas comosus TaxID=4615 RepID=A0A6P5EYG9_ANACO|nr:pentatricopeptide repeat-containing protein At1g11290, chloroplastic-like [Ananas comosus]
MSAPFFFFFFSFQTLSSSHLSLHITRSALSHSFTSFHLSHTPLTLRSRLRHLSRAGDHLGLLSLFARARRERAVDPDRPIYLSLLKSSAALPSLSLLSSLFAHILKSGFQSSILVSTAVVDAFAKCSDIGSACKVFDGMPERDVVAWNAMLSGYSRNGHADAALDLFREMGLYGEKPNSLTLSVLLQVSSGSDDKRIGRSIHGYVVRHCELGDVFLGNSLLVYYNKVGDVHVSERLFDRMGERNVVSWNAMIAGYTQNGLVCGALEAFHLLRDGGLNPDIVALETTLQACAQLGEDAIDDGKLIHTLIIKSGCFVDVYAMNSLLLVYCRCGKMDSAQSLFDEMVARNIVSWNILVDGYVRMKCPEKALALIRCSRLTESALSSELLVSSLQAVRLLCGHVELVESIHCLAIAMGLDSDKFVGTSLLTAYGDCGEIGYARKFFDHVLCKMRKETFLWNIMLSICSHNGCFSEGFELLRSMQCKGCPLDAVTLVNGLSICTQSQNFFSGKAIHGYVLRNKFEVVIFATTSLLEFYISLGLLNVACHLFSTMQYRNIVTWNTMIHGCLQNGFPRLTLKLFHFMQQKDGFVPDSTSIAGVIEAIALRGQKEERKFIHQYVLESGFVDDEFVANSLIAMHSRFHEFDEASSVFSKASNQGTIAWNNMIAGYSYHGLIENALSLFRLMKLNNVDADSVTLLTLLQACRKVSSLSYLMRVHAFISKLGFESDVLIGSSVVNLYAKCGELRTARQFFDGMNSKTVVSWNSMIQGYGLHGNVEVAGELFVKMQKSGLTPTAITFLILISACSHAGDIEKGQQFFNLMTSTYSLALSREHVSSIIDLLGRNGLVEEAHETLMKMPVNLGVHSWGALLSACRVHGNFDVGFDVAENLSKLNSLNCGYRVLLSNMRAEAGRWLDASLIRNKYSSLTLQKVHGVSIVDSFS